MLALGVVVHGPDQPLHRREEGVGTSEQEVPADRFAVPAGYREIGFEPDCLQRS